MSAFEFAFTLFGLVLGLALTAVLAGFVGVLKARTSTPRETLPVRFGWLTPLLAAVVVVDLITFWIASWNVRENIVVTTPVLLFGTALTSIYFVTASLIFPDNPEKWPDLDVWFDSHKRQISAGIVVANIGFSVVTMIGTQAPWTAVPVMQYAYILLMLSLTMTRRRWQSLTVLILLSALLVWPLVGLPIF